MTTVLDFGSPEAPSSPPPQHRQSTSRSSNTPRSPATRQPPATVHFPATRDDIERDRRGSVVSHMSAVTTDEAGMRHRRPERSNTITSYRQPEHPNWQPGAEPGIDTSADNEILPYHLSILRAECDINIIDFSVEKVWRTTVQNDTLAAALEQERDPELPCRWISVNGLSWDVIQCLGNKYSLHRLAIEDLTLTHTRTKVDWYSDHAFVVLTLQKLVKLHQHKGQDGKCDCLVTGDSDSTDSEDQLKPDPPHKSWWQRSRRGKQRNVLPRYLDKNMDGKVDEFVQAHNGLSEESPIRPIRTLHRYENAQIPEHTAFMEKHSPLAIEDMAVSVEQVSIFLLENNTIISFFENSAGDVEVPIIDRLQSAETMLRTSCDASLMLQAIIDAIVDLAVPVKDAYNKLRKELQVDAMTNPDIKTSRSLHIFGEEVDMLQNLFKPIVQLVNALREHNPDFHLPSLAGPPVHEEHNEKNQPKKQAKPERQGPPSLITPKLLEIRKAAVRRGDAVTSVRITPLAHTYFGDVLDHCLTMIQALEQMDASASNISTLIFNTVGARTNNFMMILAVVTVFFAPLTFISGYFGMNFASGSGLAHPFAYFWVVAIPSLVAFMLVVFATMLWDNIRDFFAKRGIRAVRRNRNSRR
ncbi:hypothetical protein LTR08_000233 [Meristemomyces frigidus]|nr:hypothetical protein LTR08_000233 [Meristemomyces frigidus]